jgi:hypothetical protein
VCVLGTSNQNLPVGTTVDTFAALLGRPWRALRQNQIITNTSFGPTTFPMTAYDAGMREQYREIHVAATSGAWAAMAGGSQDTNLSTLASTIAATGRWTAERPFRVCFHHEASLTSNDICGTPQDRINAWRHGRDLFDSNGWSRRSKTGAYLGGCFTFWDVGWDRMFVGLNGVGPPTAGDTFEDYDPNLGSSPAASGTSYYDGIGNDLYNENDGPGVLRYGTDAATLLDPIVERARARGVDWIMPVFGCADGATTADHRAKAAWLDSVRRYLHGLGKTGPGVCRMVCFTCEPNYRPDSSAESLAAFRRWATDPYFA